MVTHGPKHEFLGLDSTLNEGGTITIGITCYVQHAHEKLKDLLPAILWCPWELDQEEAKNSCSIVSLLLYISWRCCLDIQTVMFSSNGDCIPFQDWKILKCILHYSCSKRDDALAFGVSNIGYLRPFIDTSMLLMPAWKVNLVGHAMIQTKVKHKRLNQYWSHWNKQFSPAHYLGTNISWWARILHPCQHPTSR